jgi:tetratricopeptide (TPR) repeat protein
MGMLDEAILFGERAQETANRFESDQELFLIAYRGSSYAHWVRGDVKKAAEFGQVLLDYGKRHSNILGTIYYYLSMGYSRSIAGDISSAMEFYKKTIQHTPDTMTSNPATLAAKTLLGMGYLSLGQMKEAQDAFEEIIEHSKRLGFEFVGGPALMMKGTALFALGNVKEGIALTEKALRTLFESKSLWRYAQGNYLMGRVYSKIAQGGDGKKDFSFLIKNIGFLMKTLPFAHKKAAEHLNIAIKTAGEIGAKSILGQAYLELGQLHHTKGKAEKARECINHAIDAFEKCEADVFLKQAREALAALG